MRADQSITALLERIQKDGVDEANAQAARIVDAKARAKAIVDDAKARAARELTELEEKKARAHDTMRLAARDFLQARAHALEAQLIAPACFSLAERALDKEIVAHVVTTLLPHFSGPVRVEVREALVEHIAAAIDLDNVEVRLNQVCSSGCTCRFPELSSPVWSNA